MYIFIRTLFLFRAETNRLAKLTYGVGFAMMAIAFFGMWIPDNLACSTVGWMHLHAWFHVTVSLVPCWSGVLVLYRFYENQRLRRQAACAKAPSSASVNGRRLPTEEDLDAASEDDVESAQPIPVPRIVLAESIWTTFYPHVHITWKKPDSSR